MSNTKVKSVSVRVLGIGSLVCLMANVLWGASDAGTVDQAPALRHSEVVFMYAAAEEAYRAYEATLVAWGGAEKAEQVKRHHDLGIRCTGSMWCLTAGAENIHKDPK